jgi:hypothetical protein
MLDPHRITDQIQDMLYGPLITRRTVSTWDRSPMSWRRIVANRGHNALDRDIDLRLRDQAMPSVSAA